MLHVSKLADYAIVILVQLDHQVQSAHHLAVSTHLPLPTVSKLLKKLQLSGVLTSIRGPDGGYRLNRLAQEITLAEIMRIVDGPIALMQCNRDDVCCVYQNQCELRSQWAYINRLMLHLFQTLTIEDMKHPLEHTLMWKKIPPHRALSGGNHVS